MARKHALIAASSAVYAVGAFLTFGLTWNEAVGLCNSGVECRRKLAPVASGVWWPVYWAGALAIDLTRNP